jgi:threonine dehydrogenase-like Zn-dependent dehydrogenase
MRATLGAVGLSAVLAARRLGTEQIVLMGSHKVRTDLGREFGAVEVVSERGAGAAERVRELTGGDGTGTVLDCVGTMLPAKHVRDILNDPRVSAAIYNHPGPPGGNLGLQISGTAEHLTSESSASGWQSFKIKPREIWCFDVLTAERGHPCLAQPGAV